MWAPKHGLGLIRCGGGGAANHGTRSLALRQRGGVRFAPGGSAAALHPAPQQLASAASRETRCPDKRNCPSSRRFAARNHWDLWRGGRRSFGAAGGSPSLAATQAAPAAGVSHAPDPPPAITTPAYQPSSSQHPGVAGTTSEPRPTSNHHPSLPFPAPSARWQAPPRRASPGQLQSEKAGRVYSSREVRPAAALHHLQAPTAGKTGKWRRSRERAKRVQRRASSLAVSQELVPARDNSLRRGRPEHWPCAYWSGCRARQPQEPAARSTSAAPKHRVRSFRQPPAQTSNTRNCCQQRHGRVWQRRFQRRQPRRGVAAQRLLHGRCVGGRPACRDEAAP